MSFYPYHGGLKAPSRSLDCLPGQVNPCSAEHFLTTVEQLTMPEVHKSGSKAVNRGEGCGARGTRWEELVGEVRGVKREWGGLGRLEGYNLALYHPIVEG